MDQALTKEIDGKGRRWLMGAGPWTKISLIAFSLAVLAPSSAQAMGFCDDLLRSLKRFVAQGVERRDGLPASRDWGDAKIETATSGIVLNDKSEIMKAVKIFAATHRNAAAEGVLRNAQPAPARLLEAYARLKANDVWDKIFKRFEDRVQLLDGPNCRISFDYDAIGTPFFKTTFSFVKRDRQVIMQVFSPRISSAEQQLAEAMQRPVMVGSVLVSVPIAQHGSTAAIDLRAALGSVLSARAIKALVRDQNRKYGPQGVDVLIDGKRYYMKAALLQEMNHSFLVSGKGTVMRMTEARPFGALVNMVDEGQSYGPTMLTLRISKELKRRRDIDPDEHQADLLWAARIVAEGLDQRASYN